MERDELKQLICECIDENNVCGATLEIQDIGFQLTRIENQQRYLRDYVNDALTPAIQEIRDTLREQKESKNDNHRSSDG